MAGFGIWLTGKLGLAWVGALVVHGVVHGCIGGGCCVDDVVGWEKCI